MILEGKIVFIAGAITGVADYKEQFTSAEKNLQEQGATVKSYMVLALAMIQCAVMEQINGRRIHENRRVYHYFEGDVLRPQR